MGRFSWRRRLVWFGVALGAGMIVGGGAYVARAQQSGTAGGAMRVVDSYSDGLTPDNPPTRRLYQALMKGDLAAVKQAIADGGDLNARMGPHQEYPIALAVGGGEPGDLEKRAPLLRYVAEQVKDPGVHDSVTGASLLMLAADIDDLEAAHILVRRGVDINAKSPEVGGFGGVNALWSAILYGGGRERHLSKVAKFLIEHGADVNQPFSRGMTPLMQAALYGKEEVIRELLAHGADPSAKAPDGRTALDFARRSRYPEVASLLLGHTKLDMAGAARFGKIDELNKLLASGGDPNLRSGQRELPLNAAILGSSEEAVRVLLDHGAKVDLADRAGRLPIHVAAGTGNAKAIDLLVKHGADVNARLATKEPIVFADTPLQHAIAHVQPAAVEALLRHGAKITEAGRGRSPLAFAISRAGMSPERSLEGGKARMPEEFLAGQDKIIELLLDHGADPKANGGDAVYAAAENGQAGLLRMLLDRGGSPNSTGVGMSPWRDRVRRPAISAAIWALSDPRWQQEEMKKGTLMGPDEKDLKEAEKVTNAALKLLLDRGANVNAADENGATPLMEAIFWDALDVAKMLVAKGARVDAVNSEGETALIMAARDGKVEAVKFLLAHKANVNLASKSGMTPLLACVDPEENEHAKGSHAELEQHVVQAHGYPRRPLEQKDLPNPDGRPAIVRMLLAHGANANARDRKGRTALQLAKAQGFTEVAALLGSRH